MSKMIDKQRMNLSNPHHQLIVGAMANMVAVDGLTPHQVIEVMRDIESNVFFSLAALDKEVSP